MIISDSCLFILRNSRPLRDGSWCDLGAVPISDLNGVPLGSLTWIPAGVYPRESGDGNDNFFEIASLKTARNDDGGGTLTRPDPVRLPPVRFFVAFGSSE